MRKALMTVALAALLVVPALAQRGPGMFGGQQKGDMLLLNKSVQKELKLTDEQTKELAEIQTKQAEVQKEAFPLFREEREKAMEMLTKANEEATKAVKGVRGKLTSEQAKRFGQIEIQVAATNKDVTIFKNEAVVKALSITDKQQTMIKDTLTGVEKDTKELQDDLKSDPSKGREVFGKIRELNTEAFDKVVKELSADQQKAWKDAQGEAFKIVIENPFGKGKGKDKGKKKDDF